MCISPSLVNQTVFSGKKYGLVHKTIFPHQLETEFPNVRGEYNSQAYLATILTAVQSLALRLLSYAILPWVRKLYMVSELSLTELRNVHCYVGDRH